MGPATLPDRVARTALGLMLVLPFANPIHTAPIPSYWSEWLAALLGLVAITATLAGAVRAGRPLPLPPIVALPLLLAVATTAQALAGHVAHPRQALLVAATQLLAAAMMIAGRAMAERHAIEDTAAGLARWIVAGSLLQCLVLALQTAGIGVPWLVFLPAEAAVAAGSLSQANHLADYLWLGIAATLFPMARRGRVSAAGVAAVVAIAAASTLSSSRSVMLYPVGLAAAAMVAWRACRAPVWRHIALLCLATLPLMLAVDGLPGSRSGLAPGIAPTLGERLATSGGDRIRSSLYQVVFEESLQRPLFGHGVGASPWVTFQRVDDWPQGARPAIAENPHNVVLQWLLEYGYPLTMVALCLPALWLRRALPGAVAPGNGAAPWWALASLTIIAIHSQLEYPLWFAYFLLPASWMLGAFDSGARALALSRVRQGIAAAALLLGVAILGGLARDYRELERIEAAARDPRQWSQALAAAVELDLASLLAPNALLFVVGAMAPDGEQREARLALCGQAMRVSPRPEIVAKCALVARLNGQPEQAERLLHLDRALRQK